FETGRGERPAVPAITEAQPAGPTMTGAAFPPHLMDAALCLQMEDHHVRVHTVGRSYLHLAPLRQVAEELGPERGLQVHRSWWVAQAAVQRWEEAGRSVVLVLTDGRRVPVARNRVAQLRAIGWLDPSNKA
ncbi:MAG TPA: LytTR family DNA-binding domain-containing protein, partial [Sphingomonas sp.]|nr:LytTR family DNA-binding domain-containing protein [Sphingomonas sp.]